GRGGAPPRGGGRRAGRAGARPPPDGHIAEARVGLTNMGSTPLRATAAEQALSGADGPEAVARAAEAAAEGARPSQDLSASPEYRAHLARVLTKRAVLTAAGMG
ncbi:hypothetical protein ACFW2E_16195, partial [Streptomyces sp. NPDC058964]